MDDKLTPGPVISPIQEPSHYYPYEPGQYVKRMATHVLENVPLYVIRRINSKPHEEAYEVRYLDRNGILVLDILFPQEFIFEDIDK